MRIVTRPDFDGIVCAVLLRRALNITSAIHWIEPNEIQSGKAIIQAGDILANLPFSPECELWFDHHISNKPEGSFNGAFDIAPSAAGVIYTYYKEQNRLDNQFDELIFHTDIIDAAKLTQDQVLFPEKYPYILLSMTIKNHDYQDIEYWNHLVDLLGTSDIETIMQDEQVKIRCKKVIKENKTWADHLTANTRIENKISITDFRSLETVPDGNRFLTYCLFTDTIASVKIRYHSQTTKDVQISIGKSIFTPGFNINIGKLLSQYGGGGHAGAGGCTLPAESADQAIEKILQTVCENEVR